VKGRLAWLLAQAECSEKPIFQKLLINAGFIIFLHVDASLDWALIQD
jgi:hypothetical protein